MNKFELIKEVIDFAAPSVKNNAAVLAQKNKEIATKNKIRNNYNDSIQHVDALSNRRAPELQRKINSIKPDDPNDPNDHPGEEKHKLEDQYRERQRTMVQRLKDKMKSDILLAGMHSGSKLLRGNK